MCFTYIIKHFCGKTWKLSFVFNPIAYYIYVFAQCLVGFDCVSVVKPFEITEIIWRSDAEL